MVYCYRAYDEFDTAGHQIDQSTISNRHDLCTFYALTMYFRETSLLTFFNYNVFCINLNIYNCMLM